MTRDERRHWLRVESLRVYLAHHSVGDDLLRGMQALAQEAALAPLRLVDLDAAPSAAVELPGGFLAHSRPGRNGDPVSKIEAFARRLDAPQLSRCLDVAALKLCYADFGANSPVDEIFRAYCSTLAGLQQRLPRLRFLHVSVPLMTRDRRLVSRARRLIGRTPWRDEANARRCEFNERLAASCDPTGFFDLARIESTRPDGHREAHPLGQRTVYSLHAGYARDGGHLNATGARLAAAGFAESLARSI